MKDGKNSENQIHSEKKSLDGRKSAIPPMAAAVAGLSLFIVIPIFYLMLFNSSFFSTGMPGYIGRMILRATLGIIGIAVSFIAIKKIPAGKNKEALIILLIGVCLMVLGGWRFVRGLGDIPYLDDPKTMVLSRISFNDSADDEYNAVDGIYGIDESGKFRSFDISDSMFDEAKKTLRIDYKNDVTDQGVRAKIYYLPGTRTVMKVEYLRAG